jgi:hypothetical protein
MAGRFEDYLRALRETHAGEHASLSLPGWSRQSRATDRELLAPAVVMDARNECGHDMGGDF